MKLLQDLVTVRDRVTSLGLRLDKFGMWKAGNLVRDAWLRHVASGGHLPLKVLRTKARGSGSHCFAVYPAWFVPWIDRVVRKLAEVQRANLSWLDRARNGGRKAVRRTS